MELVLYNLKVFNKPLLSFGWTAVGILRNAFFFFLPDCLTWHLLLLHCGTLSSLAHISQRRTKHHAYWRFFSILALVGALKRNIALQELYLSENKLNGYQDSMQLADLLKYNNTLRALDLSNNATSDSGTHI